MSFSEHLLRARSEDGLRLDGVAIFPEGEFRSTGIVWVHDRFSCFYHPPYVELGRALANRGYLSVIGNTRGHDLGALFADRVQRPIVGGGGWERFHESPYDVAAWLESIARIGASEVVVIGHGYGGRKGVYYQVERSDPRVSGVAIASAGLDYPPVDREMLDRAEAMVSQGRGRDLLPWPPIGAGMSAQTYVDGEMTYRNILCEHNGRPSAISRLRVPVLAFYGDQEDSAGQVAQNLETIARNATLATSICTGVVPGSGRLYEGCEELVADLIAEWIDTLP